MRRDKYQFLMKGRQIYRFKGDSVGKNSFDCGGGGEKPFIRREGKAITTKWGK